MLPPAVRRELAVIAASAGVVDRSVEIVTEADGAVTIRFVLETERFVEKRPSAILDREPVELRYSAFAAVGVEAPLVTSGRADFPRTLPHLNPVLPDQPASLCLARAGLQTIYDRYGVEGLLQRLRSWMRAAQAGSLSDDGWDPVPIPVRTQVRQAWFDGARFQDLAVGAPAGTSVLTGVARVSTVADYVVITDQIAAADKPAHNSALRKAVATAREGARQVGIPWVLVWPANHEPNADAVFGTWTTYKELRDGLAAVGLAGPLEAAIGSVMANGCDCKHAPGRKTIVVIVGLWRPVPLGQGIFGLSADPLARSLELKAFTLEATVSGEIIDDATPVRALIADPFPGPAVYRWVSGTPVMRPAAMIGYGALGSEIGDHLLRGGLEQLTTFDADRLAPHNPARHRALPDETYLTKAQIFENRAKNLSAFAPSRHKGIAENLVSLPDAEVAKRLEGSAVIIDATADERVRMRLTHLNSVLARQVIRTELLHSGRLGVEYVTTGSGNPDLFDLYNVLCHAALDDADIADWLSTEHLVGPDSAELVFGFGCSSLTTRLPGFVVAQHAAAFMPTIVRCLEGAAPAGIGINVLDAQFLPRGWRWLAVPSLVELSSETAPGWSIRLHPDVVRRLTEERGRKLPAETGGYLYGAWDLRLKRITVVVASDEPPGSNATADGIELGPSGQTEFEKRLNQATRGRIVVCGSWHSHPPAFSADLSPKDIKTMAAFRERDDPLGLPTLFVVSAEGEIAAHLIV